MANMTLQAPREVSSGATERPAIHEDSPISLGNSVGLLLATDFSCNGEMLIHCM